jgi:transposase-like protein
VKYTDTFKNRMVQKLAMPLGPSAGELSTEVGVPQPTLSRWLREAGRVNGQDVVPLISHTRSPMSAKRPQDWTAEEKLAVVIEAAAVAEEDLGGFLRRQGLHEAQLDEWRRQVLASLGKQPARSSKRSGEARRVKELEKELHRKDKALAETAALLVLQKKVRALWGDGDDTTAQKNGR